MFAADQAITVRKPRGLERWERRAAKQRAQGLHHKVTQRGQRSDLYSATLRAVVGAEPMDTWLRRTLDAWPGSRSLAALGVYLRDEWKPLRRPWPTHYKMCWVPHIGASIPCVAPLSLSCSTSRNINKFTDGPYSRLSARSTHRWHFPRTSDPQRPPCAPADPGHKSPAPCKESRLCHGGSETVTSRSRQDETRGKRLEAALLCYHDFPVGIAVRHAGPLCTRPSAAIGGRSHPVCKTAAHPHIEGPFDVAQIPWPCESTVNACSTRRPTYGGLPGGVTSRLAAHVVQRQRQKSVEAHTDTPHTCLTDQRSLDSTRYREPY